MLITEICSDKNNWKYKARGTSKWDNKGEERIVRTFGKAGRQSRIGNFSGGTMPKRTVLLLWEPFKFEGEAMDVVYIKLAQYQLALLSSLHRTLAL